MHKSKIKIFTFVRPSENSVIPSLRIANFLHSLSGAEIVWDDTWDFKKPYKVLFLVNGAFAFCKYLPQIAEAIVRAERVIWVQNDYTIIAPKAFSNATSPFRKAFVTRRKRGMASLEFWTTVESSALAGHYVNWNCLTYNPLPEYKIRELRQKSSRSLFYYGSFRANRVKMFDHYFDTDKYPVVISSPSKHFATRYAGKDNVSILPAIRENFLETLTRQGLGLYIEDAKSTKEFMSPANRFYEMLSAGLPMVFHREAVSMLKRAGIDVSGFTVHDANEMMYALWHRNEIAAEQWVAWSKDYVGELKKKVSQLIDDL